MHCRDRVGRRVQHQGELTAQAVAVSGQPGGQFGSGQGVDLFKLLGQFTAYGDRPHTPPSQRLRQSLHAVGRLQQHHGAGLVLQALQRRCALGSLGGQKAGEHKTRRCGVVDPCGAQQRGDAAGAGQRDHAQTLVAQLGHQARAGVADAGRPRVADIRDALPLAQSRGHFLGGLHFVVLVHGQQLRGRLVDAVGA